MQEKQPYMGYVPKSQQIIRPSSSLTVFREAVICCSESAKLQLRSSQLRYGQLNAEIFSTLTILPGTVASATGT
jgi:hypothetical protein